MISSNIFNKDFQELIEILNKNSVEYLLVGGYSVILHGYSRTTGDLDLWINPTEQNYIKLIKAFSIFGLPTTAIELRSFLNTEEFDVFSFGIPPVSLDFITKIKGLNFGSAFVNSLWYEFEDKLKVRVISKGDLIKAKKASGRNKDLDDIENIT